MIYKLNNKKLRKKMKEFGKTTYGKSIFIICFTPFIISFLITITLSIFYLSNNYLFNQDFVILVLFTIISFSLGNYGYYKELRIFTNK